MKSGHFGPYGGVFVPETLIAPLQALERAWISASADENFQKELQEELAHFAGRPTPILHAPRLSEKMGGAGIYLKREDLLHLGAHKINNAIGQALLAKKMGKTRLIAETGAGQHGVATAAVAARYGFSCCVYMGEEDMARQAPNVLRMRLLGAEVVPVHSGSKTLKDAMNEAMRDWVTHVDDTYYLIGTVAGPHPYPSLVRDFQKVIGEEARAQMQGILGRDPEAVVAAVGGGSNAMGIFAAYLESQAKLVGVEAAGKGLDTPMNAASLLRGHPGVLHGNRTYILQDAFGQVQATHSISAGLDYPGVGPEHAFLKDSGRVRYVGVTDKEALDAFLALTRLEGIIPALESAHALAHAMALASAMPRDTAILVNLSGRGDKDLATAEELLKP